MNSDSAEENKDSAAPGSAEPLEAGSAENPESASGRKVKIIKRYQNRKLYDTERSCYVTLHEIADLIKQGEDVKVIDNKTKRDLTSLTLAQIIFEEEKKRKRLLPLELLKNIIQSSSAPIMDFWKRSFSSSVTSLAQAQDELEHFFQKLIAKGALSSEEGQHLLQSFVSFSHRSLEEIQKRLDEGARETLNRMLPGRDLRTEFQLMRQKIEALEKKLSELEPK